MFSIINEVLESEKSQPLWDEWFSNGGEIKETKKKDGRKSKL